MVLLEFVLNSSNICKTYVSIIVRITPIVKLFKVIEKLSFIHISYHTTDLLVSFISFNYLTIITANESFQ